MNVSFCTTEESVQKKLTSPLFTGFRIINTDLVTVFRKQSTIKMDKMYALGFTILERSKLHMFQCFYEIFQPYFGVDNVSMLFSDTDSLAMKVKTPNLDAALLGLKKHFDFSNYPEDHHLFDNAKKNQTGYFKDELASNTFSQFVGLRSKAYCMQIKCRKTDELQTHNKCKGISKSYRKKIHFKSYLKCIKDIAKIECNMRSIQSKNHMLKTINLRKIAVSSFDDKRYLFWCGIHSVGYGSSQIRDNKYCPFCQNEK